MHTPNAFNQLFWFIDWVEEQMAPLVESMEPRKVRTYEEKLCDAQEEAADLNWIHYLGMLNRKLWKKESVHNYTI